MNRTKYLIKNTAIFALGNLGTKLINFFLIPLYTNVLTTEQYGITDLFFTVCSIAVPVIIININEAIMRFALDEDADRNKIMSTGIVVIIASMFSALILYVIAAIYTPISEYRVYVYLYAVTYGICEINICYLRGKEKLMAFSVSNVIRTLSIAVFNILFLVVWKMGIPGYLIAYITANMVTALFAFFAGNVWDVCKHFSFDKELFKRMVRYSLPLIPTSLMWWIINSSDRLMITAMINVSVSGVFAVSSKIPALISFISTIFNQAFSYSAIHEEKSEDRVEFNNRIFDYLFGMVTVFGLFVLMILKLFMKIYVSAEFFSAWNYTPPLIVGTCLLVLGTFFSVSYTVNKDSIGFLKSGALGALVNVILNLSLIPVLGAWGAAFATFVSYVIVFVYRYFDIRKYLKLDVFTLKHIASMLLLFTAGALTYANTVLHVGGCALMLIAALFLYKENWTVIGIKLLKRK